MLERFLFSLALGAGVDCFALLSDMDPALCLGLGVVAALLTFAALWPSEPLCDKCGRTLSHLYGSRWTCSRCKRDQAGPEFDAE